MAHQEIIKRSCGVCARGPRRASGVTMPGRGDARRPLIEGQDARRPFFSELSSLRLSAFLQFVGPQLFARCSSDRPSGLCLGALPIHAPLFLSSLRPGLRCVLDYSPFEISSLPDLRS